MEQGKIFYAKTRDVYIIKLVGDVRYTTSVSLDSFLNKLFRVKHFNNIIIDLTEATNVDSTTLGLLAKIANFVQTKLIKHPVIVSTNPDINKILTSICFDKIFLIISDSKDDLDKLTTVPDVTITDAETARIILEAHQNLMSIDEENRHMFKDVVSAFETEVSQTKFKF